MGTNSKEYMNAYYKANREKRMLAVKANLERKKKWYRDYKESQGCMDCGNKFPYYVLDLDHRDPSTKTINPAQMIIDGWSIDRMKVEIEKCDVVCANCHRHRTHLRGLMDKAADF